MFHIRAGRVLKPPFTTDDISNNRRERAIIINTDAKSYVEYGNIEFTTTTGTFLSSSYTSLGDRRKIEHAFCKFPLSDPT